MDSEKFSIDDRFLGFLIAYNLRRKKAIGHTNKEFMVSMLEDYRDLKKGRLSATVLVGVYKTAVLEKIEAIKKLSRLIKESDDLKEKQENLRQILILEDELEDILNGR